MSARIPFDERGGVLRGALDLVSGRFPSFVFGGPVGDMLPVFHFHDETRESLLPKLRHLAENGYRTVGSDEIAAYARKETRLAPRSVALCFDDAWASLGDVAAPLLKEHGLTAITYAIPARMSDAGPSPFVTWPDLAALAASGVVDVQCHTYSHSRVFCGTEVVGFVDPSYGSTLLLNRPQLTPPPRLRFLTPDDLGAPIYPARSRMSGAARAQIPIEVHERCVQHVAREGGAAFFSKSGWRSELEQAAAAATPANTAAVERPADRQKAVEDELDRGRAMLNDRLKIRSVNHACLPWGVSSDETAKALARLGFRSAFANRMRGMHAVRAGDDPFWLKRLPNRYILRLPGRGRRWFA